MGFGALEGFEVQWPENPTVSESRYTHHASDDHQQKVFGTCIALGLWIYGLRS